MSEQLSKKQQATNKIKLDEARGASPDPKNLLIAPGKQPKPSGGQVRIGIDAPREIAVHREKIYQKILAEGEQDGNR